MNVEDYALGIWQSGTNDEVWDAMFRWPNGDMLELEYSDPECYPPGATPGLADIAGEMLPRIEATGFTVGDMSTEEVVAAILRRYPILGPNPNFGS